MISSLGSDPPKVFLLLYQTYIINFRVCWTHKYFVLLIWSIFAISTNFCLFIILVFQQPWKLTTNLLGYCSKDCQCLSFVLLMPLLLPTIRHDCKCNTILDVSGVLIKTKKVITILLLFNVRLSSQLIVDQKNNLKMYIKPCFMCFSN